MKQSLAEILKIQELDMNMLRLLGLRDKRQKELKEMQNLRKELEEQRHRKEHEVLEIKKNIKLSEGAVRDAEEKIKEIEGKQQAVKKVDEFNALSKQMTETERGKVALEHKISDLTDQLANEEEVLANITESLSSTQESSDHLQIEIQDAIAAINQEGQALRPGGFPRPAAADEQHGWHGQHAGEDARHGRYVGGASPPGTRPQEPKGNARARG